MRVQAQLVDGWICVPYSGSDLQRVELAVDKGDPQPAFLDYSPDGQRVAKLRPAALGNPIGQITLTLRVDGVIAWQGTLTL